MTGNFALRYLQVWARPASTAGHNATIAYSRKKAIGCMLAGDAFSIGLLRLGETVTDLQRGYSDHLRDDARVCGISSGMVWFISS